MKKNRLLLVAASALLLSGCSSIFNRNSSISIIDSNNYDSDKTDDVSSDSGSNEFDSSSSSSEEIVVPSEYDSFDGYEISKEGNYYLSGTYPKINITASKGSELYIFLDGVSISCSDGIAFASSKQITLHLVLLNNSSNEIINDFEDENAFHIKGNVYISGEGTLNITSKQKNGLKVSKDLFVYEGVTLNVKGYNHAIAARSITTSGATISVISETKDGIQLECDSDITAFTKEQGFAYLVNTKVTADTYGDGIQADTFVYISGGEYNITTHGEFVAYSTSALTEYGLTTDDFKYVKSNNDYKRVAKDEIRYLSSSYYALKNSVKGIKAGAIEYDSDKDDVDDVTVTEGEYQIYIAHLAKIDINSTDDCIHTNYGTVTIENSNLDLETYDDGVHADYDLLINNASIGISKSYEGLEGANVTINGEDTNIVTNSDDDGINAASDLSNTNNIVINNGYLRVYASGDGLDANTALYLNGGIVLACSTSGMAERMTATQYTFLYQGSTISSGTKVSVVDSSNTALFSYTLKQSCNQVIFSHPDMASGQTYKLMSGSTSLASITMTSTLVKVGSGNQGGGPGHGPGGR